MAQNVTAGPAKNHGKHHHHHHRGHQSHIKPHGGPDQDQQHRHHHRHGQQSQHHQHHHGHGHRHQHGHHHTKGINESTSVRDQRNQTSFDSNPDNVMKFNKHTKGQQGPGQDQTYEQLLTPGIGQQEQKQAESKLNQNDSHLARVDIQNDFNFVDGIDPRATDWQSSNQTLDSDSGQLLLQNDEDDLQNLNENDQNDDLDNSDQQNDESQQNNNQSSPNESTEFQSSYYWIAKRGRILVFVQFYLVIATTAAMLEPTFLTKDRSQQWVTTASGCFILLWLSQASIGSYYPYFLGLVNFNIFLIISLFLIVFAPGLNPPEEYQDEFIPYYKPGLVPIFYKMELFSICVFFMVSAIFAGYKGDQRSRLTFFKSYSMEQMELRTDLLLKEMLPTSILEEVKQKALALNPHDNTGVMQSYQRTKIARYYRDKVILFSDISGFTAYSKTVSAYQVVSLVTSLFSRIDDLSREVGVYKVCTIGDCYVAIPEPDEDQDASNMDGNTNLQLNNQININTKAIVLSAVKMLHFSSRLLTTIQSTSRDLQVPFDMRIGLHIGNFVGGVIGTTKLRYDIWGKDVSIANLMESNGIAGKINVSRPLKSFLKRYLPGAFVYKKHKEVIIQSGLPGKKKSMIEPGGLSSNSLDQVALNQDLINQMNNTNATVDQTNISKNDMIRSKESKPFQEQSESEANSNLTGSTRLQRQHKRTDTNSNLLSVNTGDLRQTNQVDISPFQSSFNKSQSESDIPSGGQSHSDQGKTQQTKSPSIRDATSVESMWMNGSTNANNDQMKFNQQQYQQNYTNVGDSLNFDDFYNMRQSQTLNEQDRLLALTNSNKKLRKIISKEQQESKSDSFEVTQVPTNVDYDQTEVPVPNGSVTPDLNNLSISSVIKNAHFVNSTPLNSVPLQEHRHPDKQFKASHTSAVQKREFLEERRLRETMQEIEYSKRLTLNESDSDNDGKILDMTKFKNETSNLRNSNRDSGNLKLDLKDSSQGRWSNSKTQPSQAQQTSQSLNLSDLAIKELDLNQIIMVNDAEEEQQILQKDNEEGNIDADEVNEDNLNVQSDSESKTQTINKSQNLRLSLEKTDSIMDIPTVLGVSPTGTRSSALNVTKIKKANLEERSSYSQADFQSMSSNQQNLKIKEAHLTVSSTAVTYNQDSVSAQTLLTQQQFNDTPEFGVRTKNKFQSFDESLTEGSKSPEAKRSPEAITSANSTIIKLPNAPRSQIQIQNQAKQVNDTNINDNNVPAQTEISESQTVTIDPQDLNPLQAFMNSYKGPQLLASQVTSGQSESVPVPQEPDEQDIPWIDQLINDPEHGLEQCLKKQMRERFLLKSSQSGPSRLSESDANSTDLNLSLKNNTISFKDFSEAIALRNKSYNNIDPDGNASDNQQLSLRQTYGPGQKQKQYAQSPEFKKSVMEFFALRERETNKNSSRKKSELSPLSLSLKVNNNREGQHRSTINDIVINNDSNTNNNKTLRPPPQTVQHTMTYDLKERKEITMKSYIIEPTEIWLKIIEEIERRSGTGRRN